MKKIYCNSCTKEIKLKEILKQSHMFGIYCERCGEVSRANRKSKIIFLLIFINVLIINIIIPIVWWLKMFFSLIWCIIALWILQPIICEFE